LSLFIGLATYVVLYSASVIIFKQLAPGETSPFELSVERLEKAFNDAKQQVM
jgi:hypothetical protein